MSRGDSPAARRFLADLRTNVEVLRAQQARVDECVAAARRVGATWAGIAEVLDVTPQAAHKRYRHITPGHPSDSGA